jgi:ribosomal protein L7/L12
MGFGTTVTSPRWHAVERSLMSAVYSDAQVTSYIQEFFERFQRLEAQVALLSEKVGLPFELPSDSVPAEVVELAHAGDRLGAVKRYRELTGAGFEEARDAVAKL